MKYLEPLSEALPRAGILCAVGADSPMGREGTRPPRPPPATRAGSKAGRVICRGRAHRHSAQSPMRHLAPMSETQAPTGVPSCAGGTSAAGWEGGCQGRGRSFDDERHALHSAHQSREGLHLRVPARGKPWIRAQSTHRRVQRTRVGRSSTCFRGPNEEKLPVRVSKRSAHAQARLASRARTKTCALSYS